MSNFQQKYKEKKFGFGDTQGGRLIRAEERKESRKKQRIETFNEKRNVLTSMITKSENEEVQSASVTEDRRTRLMKWKAERERRRKLEQARKKAPFVVGVVHHKIYSPICNDQTVAAHTTCKKVCNQTVPQQTATATKRVTRATEKRLMSKALAQKVSSDSNKNFMPVNKEQKSQKKQVQSFAPLNHKFKAPIGLSDIPLFGRVAMQSMSPSRVSEFALSFTNTPETDRRSGTSEFIVEEINNKKENVPEVDEREGAEDSSESSIEPISLKLSFDEETFTNSDEKNNNDKDDDNKVDVQGDTDKDDYNKLEMQGNIEKNDDNKVEIQNNSVHNKSITEILSSSNKNVSISVPDDSSNEPAFFSPYVVSSRGKNNARKEQQLKRGFSLDRSRSDDIPTKDTVMRTLNISVEEEEQTAQYFRFLMNKEIDRLNDLCEKWTDIKEDATTTEDGQYEINQAIGQTNLLINKKFERFRGLVADCETGKGEMLVTCKDLQGFWDMMYMEVRDCDARFEKLDKLRSQDWIEEDFPHSKTVSVIKKKTTVRRKAVSAKSSSIKTFLTVKKKNIIQQTGDDDNVEDSETIDNEDSNNIRENNKNDSSVKGKTRRSAVFLESQKCTPVKQGKRLSLVQQVQLSSKNITSPLTVMKVSQMCKTPDVQLDDTISYINSDQTPGKSILKHPKSSTKVERPVKSVNKVNFDDNNVVLNEIPIDEETRIEVDLGAALSRIDNFDLDNPDEIVINAEKKLNFHDISSEESVDDCKENSMDGKLNEVPIIMIQSSTPAKHLNLDLDLDKSISRASSGKYLRRQDAFSEDSLLNVTLTRSEESTEYTDPKTAKQKSSERVSLHNKKEENQCNESVRVLRSRVITPVNTPSSRRSSKKMSINVQDPEQKENKTPTMKTRRKNSVKTAAEDEEKEDLENSLDKMSLNETGDKRKSHRSVKFYEDRSDSVANKSALSVTPHIRRSRAKSNENKRNTISGDLITWDTPDKPPDRVRRSRSKKV